MRDVEYVLDFTAKLGSQMLAAGANLERADDTMTRVCRSYQLCEISIFSLSRMIHISAKDGEENFASRQITVPPMDIHLEQLSRLNQLSRRVCSEKPAPETLGTLLAEAQHGDEYPKWLVLIGRLIAMSGIGVLSGGRLGDIIASDLICFVLFWAIDALTFTNINGIIQNMLCMFFAGMSAHFLIFVGLGSQYSVICITCAMMILPGIPLVNAARNLLCGNEMNGILEMIKALIETLAIVLGLGLSILLLGGSL